MLAGLLKILHVLRDSRLLPEKQESFKQVHEQLMREVGLGDRILAWLRAQQGPVPLADQCMRLRWRQSGLINYGT